MILCFAAPSKEHPRLSSAECFTRVQSSEFSILTPQSSTMLAVFVLWLFVGVASKDSHDAPREIRCHATN